MKDCFSMTARERAEMTIAVLVALQAEGADIEFEADKTRYGVAVIVTKYELNEDNDTQQDLNFALWELNEIGTDHERRYFDDGTMYETFWCDDDDDFHFECEYVNC